jgi:predicted anti-sigma-YlaC factor YlaD
MTDPHCQEILFAAMAKADGEDTLIEQSEIESHLDPCNACREELEKLYTLNRLLKPAKRRERTEQVWPRLMPALAEEKPLWKLSQESYFLWALGLLLYAYKLIEVIVNLEGTISVKLLPVFLITIFLASLKENPFKIKSSLILEKKNE